MHATGKYLIIKPVAMEAGSKPLLATTPMLSRGEVVSVGEDVSITVDVGNIVLFDAFHSSDTGDGHLAVSHRDIVACSEGRREALALAREGVYDDIDMERLYQDQQYGGALCDDRVSELDWVKFIGEYAGGTGRALGRDFRERMVKAAALAVAAVEAHDRRSELSLSVWLTEVNVEKKDGPARAG